MKTPLNLAALALSCSLTIGAISCGEVDGPQTGSQTHWLLSCDTTADCGNSSSCICGVCTQSCKSAADCSELALSSCVDSEETGATALCGGEIPEQSGLCLVQCPSEGCEDGKECVAGICTPQATASLTITVETDQRFQSIEGFGASLAYAEEEIVSHPMKSEIFDAMFTDSGLDVVRLRNRYEEGAESELDAAVEILAAATERMGTAPTTLMTSGSPPAYLKESGARLCEGNPDTCTLIRLEDESFDYAGFADHWAASLEAYSAAGILPDYVSIQNNPNWVPPTDSPNEACKFLPTEGTETVNIDGDDIEVSYPGFAEALLAVKNAIDAIDPAPKITAPETNSVEAVSDYVSQLNSSAVDVLAHHLYDIDPQDIDENALSELNALSEDFGQPLFQTEMRSDGFDTAVLMQAALTVAGASMYLQNDFVSPGGSEEDKERALIAFEDDSFSLRGPFHTMRHFAERTAPGWVRVATNSSHEEHALLSSAFLSPKEDALTIVLVNNGAETHNVEVDLQDESFSDFKYSEVHRTTFDGVEQYVDLGQLPSTGAVQLPTRAIVTVALYN